MDVPPISEACNDFLQKLGLEIATARPGSDQGQLPILDLLSNLRDLFSQSESTKPGVPLIQEAYQLIESIVESGKAFSKQDLEKFQSIYLQVFEKLGMTVSVVFPKWEEAASKPSESSQLASSSIPVFEEEEPLVLNLSTDTELLREFINESYERLGDIERDVLGLEDKPDDFAKIHSLFRSFHTFKGGSGFLNLTPMHRLAHHLESLLDLVRNRKLGMDGHIIDIVLSGKDILQYFVMEIEMQVKGVRESAPIQIAILPLVREIQKTIDAAKSGDVALVQSGEMLGDSPENSTKPSTTAGGGGKSESSSIKVDISKLDDLLDLVGELVISQSIISHHPAITESESRVIKDSLTRLFRTTKELQKNAMSMRMIPIRGTFQKMNRMVRTLSSKIGKKVQLRITGDETELDRTIVEEVSDPLMHMISNAIDHGIEKPEDRLAAGKPEFGMVSLHAFHQGGSTVIQIRDDGAGLKKDKILQKAREKGLVKDHQVLSDREIFSLIFQPGFSTAEVVTDISGRGVGMDVVRQNIEKLRGRIDIQSQEGQGTIFTISLPLTLAIIEGFIVQVGSQRFILPAQSILKSFRITNEMLSTVHERGEMVDVRGRQVPLLRLSDFLNVSPLSMELTDGIGVLIKSEGQERCIHVDGIMGKQEVVIKGLGDLFKGNPLLTGGAILGDGTVALILDVATLVQMGPRMTQKAA